MTLCYITTFISRSDMSNMIREKLNTDTMIVNGSFESLKHANDEMQALMDPKITTRVNVEHCGSVLDDAPEVFAYNLLLFCQGLGLCMSLLIKFMLFAKKSFYLLVSALSISRSASICQ